MMLLAMSDNDPPKIPGHEFVRRGASDSGWSRSADLLYACEKCGSTMRGDRNDYFNGACGAMHLDIGAGRFGSKLGDHAILTYRRFHASKP
jgi:hypothetical protein